MKILLGICLLWATTISHAEVMQEVVEEVVVTGSYIDNEPPAQRVVRKADNLLLRVRISNDARSESQRREEIHRTLLAAIKSASTQKAIALSSVTANDFVVPLNAENHQIELSAGARPDTSEAYFRVKVAVANAPSEGDAQLLAMKRFVTDLAMEGRTLVEADGDVEVSIINPQQYRSQVVTLMAQDVRAVTDALGDDYRVILTGIDRPVEWARAGSTSVAIFIPYEYVVVPTSIAAYHVYPDY